MPVRSSFRTPQRRICSICPRYCSSPWGGGCGSAPGFCAAGGDGDGGRCSWEPGAGMARARLRVLGRGRRRATSGGLGGGYLSARFFSRHRSGGSAPSCPGTWARARPPGVPGARRAAGGAGRVLRGRRRTSKAMAFASPFLKPTT